MESSNYPSFESPWQKTNTILVANLTWNLRHHQVWVMILANMCCLLMRQVTWSIFQYAVPSMAIHFSGYPNQRSLDSLKRHRPSQIDPSWGCCTLEAIKWILVFTSKSIFICTWKTQIKISIYIYMYIYNNIYIYKIKYTYLYI